MSCFIEGDPNAPILVVGMAPGKDELEADSPFVGPSGALLWSAATRAGFTRADCFILNTIGQLPTGAGGSPSPQDFDTYWDRFHEALQSSTAKVVLLLGGDALWRVTGLTGIQGWRGYLVPRSELRPVIRQSTEMVPYKTSGKGRKKGDLRPVPRKALVPSSLPPSIKYIIPSLHPSAIMRTGFKMTPMFMYDVSRAGRALREELLEVPIEGAAVAFDIETSGSLAGDASISEIGLYGDSLGVSMPWDTKAKLITHDNLNRTDRVKVAHNIGFDLPRLEDAGIPIPDPIFCTMFACQMLQPDCPKGLNDVASMYLDIPRWKHKRTFDPDYNLLDVKHTRELYQIVRTALYRTGQLDFFEGTVMPAVRTYVSLTRRGICVDLIQQNKLRQKLSDEIAEAAERWYSFYPGVNPSSHVQLKALFYGKLGHPPLKDHKGKVSVDKTCLARLARTASLAPAVQALLSLKALEDRAEFIEVPIDPADGAVHPSYVPASKDDKTEESGSKRGIAGTGRPQAHDPNIMQVPKAIRSMYIPHHAGWKLVEFDFDAAELRVVAAVCGDGALLRALDGPDPHQTHADLWGCRREEAKTVIYGLNYGMGARKLHGIFPERKLAECEALIESVFKTYPGLAAHKEKIVSQIQKNRYLVNAFGRRRYFWDPKKDVPAALDFIPQSTVADIVWTSVKELYEIARKHGGYLLTTVHDSFLFEFPGPALNPSDGYHKDGSSAIQEIKTYLEREFPNVGVGFRLPVSYSIGNNWGELNEVAYEASGPSLDPD